MTATSVRGVTLHRMRLVADASGTLTAGEFPAELPFAPVRYFVVSGVPPNEVRGEHAHRVCEQLLVCVRGSLSVDVDDGVHAETVALDRPDVGLYIPPMVWAAQRKYSADAVQLVVASDRYDPADYIRDYAEFVSLVRR